MAYSRNVKTVPMTLVEMPEFIARSKDLFSSEELIALQVHVGTYPESGDLMPGTGGVRKLRWALEGKGKRGGARIIYYFHSGALPIFLLTVFSKNEKVDLSKSEKNELRKLIPTLVQSYQQRKRAPWPRKSKGK
jgi:hypothetical protein